MELWFFATFFSFLIIGCALVVNPDEKAARLFTEYLLNHAEVESKNNTFENTFWGGEQRYYI